MILKIYEPNDKAWRYYDNISNVKTYDSCEITSDTFFKCFDAMDCDVKLVTDMDKDASYLLFHNTAQPSARLLMVDWDVRYSVNKFGEEKYQYLIGLIEVNIGTEKQYFWYNTETYLLNNEGKTVENLTLHHIIKN